jgi:hypothetical protein
MYLQTSTRLLPGRELSADGDVVMTDAGQSVTAASIEEIAGVVPEKVIRNLLLACQLREEQFSRVSQAVDEIIAEGWSVSNVVLQVGDYGIYVLTVLAS